MFKPNPPVVTIITRTKDRPILLRRAIASVLSQTYAFWHLVIVNDGGAQAPVNDLITSNQSSLAGKITVLHHPCSLGMEAASNAGIRASHGDYITIHDDDDSWQPTFLERCVEAIRSPRVTSIRGVVTHSRRIIEKIDGETVHKESEEPFNTWLSHISLYRLAASNTFPPISFLFERKLAEEINLFDETLPVLGDWDFHYRFLCRADIELIPEMLANYHHRTAIKEEAGNTYGNTVIAGFNRHRYYENLLRNKWLREDIRRGIVGVGSLHFESRFFELAMSELNHQLVRPKRRHSALRWLAKWIR